MPTVYRAPSSPIPVGDEPWSVAVGQFNGDGHDDLAIVNNDSNNVTILLGNGTGGFAQASGSPITVANNPFSVAVGRFNGDGNDDLVVTSGSAPGNVRILLGNGNGTFSQAVGSPYTVGTGVTYGVVGSFNGDSHADLAIVTFAETLAVLLGDGSGGFTLAGPPAPIGSGPYQIVRSSFNGDSHDDLATVNYLDHSVRIWLGNGAGGFSEAAGSPIFVGFPPPSSMAIGNFNGDSHADFAVTYGGPGSLAIYLGNGSGGFSLAPGGPISVEYAPRALAVGNFNGDSHDDIAVPSSSSDYVTILLGNGSAGFSPAVESPVPTGDVPIAVAVGDFDGNSLDDLALANLTSDDVTILLGGCPVADLGVSVTDAADPSVPGGTITYTITVQNFGPDPAATVSLSHPLPAGTTFVSVAPPNGWHCAVPSVGGAGTVTCTIPYLPPGTSAFTLVVQVGAGVAAPGMLMTTTSVDAATGESAGGNNAFSVTTSLVAATATSTSSPTLTPTTTLTPTPTLTPGGTPFSATATLTPSPTATRTPTSTATPTPTPTPSPTPFASAPKDEKEDKQKETEQQQLQREHTNRSGIDDVATEGNVIAVDLTANPPTITIANRDGVVTLVWVGPPDQLPRVGPGDYIQVDGQKVTEQLYEITDLSVD